MITTSINLTNTSVEFVGTTKSFAWIKFSNGLQIDLNRTDLEAIVDKFNQDQKIEGFVKEILASK